MKRILQEALDTSDVMNVSIGRECFNDDADLERIAAQILDESVMQRSQIANCEGLSRCNFLAENAPARLALLDFLARSGYLWMAWCRCCSHAVCFRP